MLVQLYDRTNENSARAWSGDGLVIDIRNDRRNITKGSLERILARWGWRRRDQWSPTDWGWQAQFANARRSKPPSREGSGE